MSVAVRARLALALSVATISMSAVFVVLNLVNVPTIQASDVGEGLLILGVPTFVSLLGTLIVRRTGNPIGWIFVTMALALALTAASEAYVTAAFRPHPRNLPFVEAAAWLERLVNPFVAAPIPALLLLFPTGQPRSRRWRWAIWMWALGIGCVAVWGAFHSGHYGQPPAEGFPQIGFDYSVPSLPDAVATWIVNLGLAALVGSGLLGVVCLILRYRAADGDERLQMRWLTFVASLTVIFWALLVILDSFTEVVDATVIETLLWSGMVLSIIAGVPAAVAVAILKYRLYDVDVVINKAVVYGSLAVFITVVYVGIVVGVGSAVGRGDESNVALQVIATALIAVAFQPVRERAQRLANRLVYGKRATPYEVLSRFTDRVAESYSLEEVLPRMARIVAEGTGAVRVRIWLNIAGELRPEATWPSDTETAAAVASFQELPDHAVEVRHQGEPLGAITMAMPQHEAMNPVQETLLRDVSAQAGLLLRNVALVEDLRASRQRLVAAQDQERRRIERDIHDGAQQQLVALAVKLRLADALVGKDEPKAHEMLAQLHAETNDALQNLRDLARGIYPPLLAHDGLVSAIRAHARKGGLPVVVSSDGIGRYPQEVEAASYFCVLEALQNVAKYADATRIGVRLEATGDELRFEVRDDGVGFDPSRARGTGLTNMRDRLEALGGSLQVGSSPGSGTRVSGRVPARLRKAVPS